MKHDVYTTDDTNWRKMNKRHNIKPLQKISGKFIFFALGIFFAQSLFAAGLYRWVDDKGIVHFGDRIPVEYAKIKREVVNSQGVVINTLDAEKTKEELIAAAQERARQEELKRQAAIKAERNRVLFSSYTSTADVDAARDAKVKQLNKQIDLLSLNSESLEQQIRNLNMRLKNFKLEPDASNAPARVRMKSQLADSNKNLAEIAKNRSKILAEIHQINKYYEKDRNDFMKLMLEKEKQRKAENHPRY